MNVEYLDRLVAKAAEAGSEWEGSIDKGEQDYLFNLAKDPRIKLIGEIGFNAGISSYIFLSANPNVHVYSFDLGKYEYSQEAKRYIDETFSGRHILIVGDSLKTVPQFHQENPTIQFDLIFVDGDHDYAGAKADLINMKACATKDTLLLTDDLTPWKPWGIGPTKAWQEAVTEGFVTQKELFKDGEKVERIEPPGERSWALGSYLFDE